jgi:signal transduction histidine kinase
MSKMPIQANIDELQSALLKLKEEKLPPQSQAILENVNQLFDSLDQNLSLSREENRLAALYRVSRALGTTLDLDQVLNQVMDAVIGLTGAERGFLVLLDVETSKWRLRAARNISQKTLRQMEISRTVLNAVIESDQGFVTTDAQSDPRFSGRESVVFYALRSIMCAPLRSRGKMIGAIYVDNRAQAGIFTESDLEMLNAFAVQAAIAIENARLYTQTDQALNQRITELETLAQVDRELNTRLDFDHVMEITRRWVLRIGEASRAWILLEGEGSSEILAVAYPEGFDDWDDPLILRSRREAEPQVAIAKGSGMSRLSVPILRGGKSFGVIVVEREQPFTQAVIEFLVHLSGRAASAIENARLYQAVEQANQAKTKFISVVTHELRIPMTSIKGYADLLRQGVVGPINEQQLSFLTIIRNNVERMGGLVSDLSDISRIEAGCLQLASSFISVCEYVDEILLAMKPRLEVKEQSVETELGLDLPDVYADPNRLMQILTNLVSNAAKYTPNGGRIHIRAKNDDGFVRVEVEDNGVGISSEDQGKLFTQFFRSEDPLVRDEQGWGLGLNVAKRLTELMGGNIGFNSDLGHGSTFWFTLPTSDGDVASQR